MQPRRHSMKHVAWRHMSSVVKVHFRLVCKVFYLNPELDFGFSSTPLPELWTRPLVLVQKGFGSGPEGDEPRTGLPKSVNHNFFIVKHTTGKSINGNHSSHPSKSSPNSRIKASICWPAWWAAATCPLWYALLRIWRASKILVDNLLQYAEPIIPPLLKACSEGVAEPWIARYSCAIHLMVGYLVFVWQPTCLLDNSHHTERWNAPPTRQWHHLSTQCQTWGMVWTHHEDFQLLSPLVGMTVLPWVRMSYHIMVWKKSALWHGTLFNLKLDIKHIVRTLVHVGFMS